MLTKIIRFEWRYHTRQISFLAATLLFAGLGFVLTATGFGPSNIHINSPYSIANGLGLASLSAVFAIAVFCANAVVRDREHLMEEIVFSTSVEKFEYLFGRFTGSFLAAFTAFSASAIGMIAGTLMPWHEPSRIGALAPHHHLWVLLVLVLPGMLFAGALLFAIATLTRNVLASVVGAVAIYIFYFIAASLTNSPLMASSTGASATPGASLLDPFGLSAFFEQTRYWTPALRNSKLVALTGTFLLNRLVWLGAAALVWLFVYRRFSFRLLTEGKRAAATSVIEAPPPAESSHYKPVETSANDWHALIASTMLEIKAFAGSIPFLLLTLMWMGLAVSQMIADVTGGDHGSALYPTTGFLLMGLDQPLSLVATVILVYYSAEMIWRERMVDIDEVVEATPASNAVFVVSKWLALSALALIVVITSIAATLVVQLLRGYQQFEPGVMLAFIWFAGMPLVLFAMAAVLIQTLSPHKYFGMLLVLALGVFVNVGTQFIEHPLLHFASPPAVEYSAMNGFGHYTAPFNWFIALWTVVGALLLLAATALWRDVRTPNAKGRRVAILLVISGAALAGFLFYNTNVISEWRSSDDVSAWKADYERSYKHAEALPAPRVVGLKADVALYPSERRYRISGSHQLVNDGKAPIAQVLVSVRRDARVVKLALSAAKLLKHDAQFATYRFQLEPPLPPNGRTTLQFDLDYANPGFIADDSVAVNGSFFFAHRAFPTLGYRRSYEIKDPSERKKRGLPPLPETADALHGDEEVAADQWVDFDVTLSTDSNQIALTSGRLDKQWTRDGRRYFHYVSDRPIHNVVVFASARYATASANVGKTRIEVYYHPDHKANVERILASASESLRYFSEQFAPYPHAELRIAEVPAYWPMGGFATPGFFVLSENRTFLIDARDPARLDLIRRRTAHEVAHQWWGHYVTAVEGPGATTITESLAKYSELLILEKTYGRELVRRSLTTELDLYLSGRASEPEPEVPLSLARNQAYLYYRKGAVVMYALKDLLGEPTLNRALRNFIAETAGPAKAPTMAALLRHIRAVAPAQHHVLIDQWLTDIVLYDMNVGAASSRRLADGRYEVTLLVGARKSRNDAQLPFDETIEIGLFAADDSVLHLSRQQLRAGTNRVTVIVDKQPFLAAVDPYITRVDADRFNNERRVE